MRSQIQRTDDLNLSCAFVTFQRRREAALAYRLLSADDNVTGRGKQKTEVTDVLFFVLCLDCFLDAKNSDDFFLTLVCFEYSAKHAKLPWFPEL